MDRYKPNALSAKGSGETLTSTLRHLVLASVERIGPGVGLDIGRLPFVEQEE